jgi:multiple sugar transport system substrate-binding protein
MSWRRIRVVAAVSLVLLLAALVAARAGESKPTAPAATKAPVTITFWNGFTGPDRPALEALVKKFNASHPNVKIDMTIMPWDVFYEKLLPGWAARKGPDMVGFDSAQIPQYADKGVLAPIGDVYGKGLPKKSLVASAVKAGLWKGKYYGVPMNFTTLLLYWNKGMFAKAGIKHAPTTWAEWQKDAVKLTIDKNKDGKPEQYGYAIADHATIPMWPILIWGNGGDLVSKDGKTPMIGSAATVKAVDQWAKLIINQHISPIGLAGADADNLFLSKKAAMEVVGPWMTSGFKDAKIDFGLAMVPKGPKRQITLGTSVAFSVNARVDADTKAGIYEWLKFWNSQSSQISWALGSGFPPNRTDIKPSQLKANPYVASFAKFAGQSQFYLANVKKFSEVNGNVFEPAIQKILNKKGSTKSVLTKAQQQMAPLLK